MDRKNTKSFKSHHVQGKTSSKTACKGKQTLKTACPFLKQYAWGKIVLKRSCTFLKVKDVQE